MSSRGLQPTVDNSTLELKIVSANDIGYIDVTEKIDVYAIVSINGDNNQKKQLAKTPIDYDGGSNPTWNHTVKFSVKEEAARQGLLTIHIKLYSYWLEDENDLYLGEVKVSVQELLASKPLQPFTEGSIINKMKPMTCLVEFGGETMPNAKVSLMYRFKPVPVKDLYPQPSAPEYFQVPFGQPVYPNIDPVQAGHPIIYSPHPQFQTVSQTPTPTKLTLELVIKSASNIRNVNVFDDMDVYASIMIREGKSTIKHKAKTRVAYSGFKFPTWNHALKFSFKEYKLIGEDEDRLTLVVELMSYRPVMGDKHIGEVKVGIQELIDLNPPSLSAKGDVSNSLKLMTCKVGHKVTGVHGETGTLSFTYRFLKEQVMVPILPDTTLQPLVMYSPVPHQSYGSADPGHMTTVQSGANVGPNNGLVPMYMPPPCQPYEYHCQQYSQPQMQPLPQLSPQKSQAQPQPHQLSQLLPGPQSQSYLYQANRYHQYSQSQPQPQLLPPQPQAKPQGGSVAALGLGAAVFGRVIGGTLMSEMLSDEVNAYEVQA